MSSSVKLYHYDAFSATPGKGNPAGVVLDAECLTEEEMQQIAYQIGFNETAFVLPSAQADLRIRYFTPGHETDLCGHATIATIYCLYERHLLPDTDRFQIETGAGNMSIWLKEVDGQIRVYMEQAPPSFVPFEAFEWMKPDTASFPEVLKQMPRCSIHPVYFYPSPMKSIAYSRHFSSPYSGTIEDPVPGTASGVIGCYYATYIQQGSSYYSMGMEQGHQLGRDGEVFVQVTRKEEQLSVSIAGTAVFVEERMICPLS